MDKNNMEKFCMLPFMLLNTRVNGTVKPCSQVQHMQGIPKKGKFEDVKNINLSPKDQFNLKETPIADIWNSEFMRDFRMKKINNEPVSCCETCYYEDRLDITSKRRNFINKFYDKYKYIVEEAEQNNGCISTMPIWWELRLSSICNLACRVCIPQSSSRMQEEFTKNYNNLSSYAKIMTDSANESLQHGYLGDSKFFMKQLWENIEDIEYIELHGGEPTLDKNLWIFLEKLIETGHSKRIYLHVHSNIILLKQHHIDVLNQFRSGTFCISIDAYKEENHYCRFPADWNKIKKNLKLFAGLDNHWQKKIMSAVGVYQSCTIHKLLWFLDGFIKKHNLNLYWQSCAIKSPEMMKVEHVPIELRLEAVEKLKKFINTSHMCNRHRFKEENRQGAEAMIRYLSNDIKVEEKYLIELLEYTESLDRIRNQNVLKIFPHLEPLFGKK